MYQPTSTVLQDQAPSWSIFDASRQVGDLPGLNDGVAAWGSGVYLWWAHGGIERWVNRRMFAAPFLDPAIASIADPAVWPDPVDVQEGGQTVYAAPDGEKVIAPDPERTPFRTFTAYAPLVEQDLMADTEDSQARAFARFQAQVSSQVAAEFADSLYTKNPGLYRTAVDQSGASPVDPVVAFSVLAEAYSTAVTDDSSAYGDAMISVPWHAIPQLINRDLVSWQGGRLIDCFGHPVNATPGQVLRGPVTDPDDLETSQAPTSGNGWFYISPRPYVGLGPVRREPTGNERIGRARNHLGIHAHSNQSIGMAEAPAIVVFRPTNVFAVETSLNEVV